MGRQHSWIARGVGLLLCGGAAAANAAPLPPQTSLANCQNAVKAATVQFIANKSIAIGTCLQAIAKQIVQNNAANASGAAKTCAAMFRKIHDSRGLGKSLGEQLTANINKKCDPSHSGVTHTLPDILGAGAGVPQPLDATDINAWCTHFGGDGSIDSLQEWRDCLAAAAECSVDAAVATQYPRALEWLALVRPFVVALPAPSADPMKTSDALAGLDAVKMAIDGPDNDNVINLQCGGSCGDGTKNGSEACDGADLGGATCASLGYSSGTLSCTAGCGFNVSGCTCNTATGTAGVADVLTGKTFSNSSTNGLSGSMPNNGAVILTPGTADQAIAAGYHNGAGKCAGTPDLVASNIKSGVTLFGVTGIFAAPTCGNGVIDGSEQCDQGNLNGETCVTQGFAAGTLACANGCVFDTSGCYAARFVDNADGTITDNRTALQWEKKVKLNGAPDFANLQDADNSYAWAGTCSVTTSKYCQPTAAAATACAAGVEGDATGCAQCTGGDGTCNATATVWTWLVALNTANFGTHNDWRLPKRAEVEGIQDLADTSSPIINVAFHGASCGVSCTDVTSPACSCTPSSFSWSSTTAAVVPPGAWTVDFQDGYVGFDSKTSGYWVRAVRGGS